jgi:hypothetical protein
VVNVASDGMRESVGCYPAVDANVSQFIPAIEESDGNFTVVQLMLEEPEVPLDEFGLVRSSWHIAFQPDFYEVCEEKNRPVDPKSNLRSLTPKRNGCCGYLEAYLSLSNSVEFVMSAVPTKLV